MLNNPTTTSTSRIALVHLTPEHYSALERAMSNILSTDLASETFAQIVDGLPTRNVYQEYYGTSRDDFHDNLEPSQLAMGVVEAHRESFRLGILQIDAKIAQRYQNALEGSREFVLRLIEIVAILCHNIAVNLYIKFEGGVRKPDPANARREPPSVPFPGLIQLPAPPLPRPFFHPYYQHEEQYPDGVADIVGYWAEYRLFGGVVLFDRGESGTEVSTAPYPGYGPLLNALQCKDVFIHPVGRYKIFQLSEAQIQQFADFVLSDPSQDQVLSQGLRFKAEKYARRVDPYDAMSLHIYRDRYERIIPEFRPRQCIVAGEDMPGYVEALQDLYRRRENRSSQYGLSGEFEWNGPQWQKSKSVADEKAGSSAGDL